MSSAIISSASVWFALRATYGREMKLKTMLEAISMECFIPMQYKYEIRNGSKVKYLAPAVRNLVFVRSTREALDEIKPELEYRAPMRYIMDPATGSPVVVPDEDMQRFMSVAGTLDEGLVYLSDGPSLRRGERVRVTGGLFAGLEGNVVRIRKDRRVLVSVGGVVAVATSFINPAQLDRV